MPGAKCEPLAGTIRLTSGTDPSAGNRLPGASAAPHTARHSPPLQRRGRAEYFAIFFTTPLPSFFLPAHPAADLTVLSCSITLAAGTGDRQLAPIRIRRSHNM